jgi:serine/threonine protein kinase
MMRRIKHLINKNSTSAGDNLSVPSSGDEKEISVSGSSGPAPREMMGYYIGPTLGQGHFARVKLGVNKETGDKAALKLIVKDAIGEESAEFRSVQREIDALSRVQHENVLRLHAVEWNAKYPKGQDKTEDVAAIILELAEGGELFDFLCYSGAMSEVVARSYFHQLIQGLEECHSKGVIHRDLKLENVLLTSDYTLKIADFGLSELNVFSDRTKMSTWCGTKRYMAPELHENRKYTLKVDTFACGIILFILLGGYPPFVYATKEDDLYKYIYSGNYNGFWKKHASYDKATFSDEVKELLNGIFNYNEAERFTIQQIKESEWYAGEVLSKAALQEELATRKAAVDAAKKKAKDKPKEKKPSKLDRLNTEEAERDFFNGASLDGDDNLEAAAQPQLWDEEELGAAIYTRFTSKTEASLLLTKMRNLIRSMKYKFSLDEQEFTIRATCQDQDTVQFGVMEEITAFIQIYQDADSDMRVVIVRRLDGDSFTFQRFFNEFVEHMGRHVYS